MDLVYALTAVSCIVRWEMDASSRCSLTCAPTSGRRVTPASLTARLAALAVVSSEGPSDRCRP